MRKGRYTNENFKFNVLVYIISFMLATNIACILSIFIFIIHLLLNFEMYYKNIEIFNLVASIILVLVLD